MARNEYAGKRVTVTLAPEVDEILKKDAAANGLKPATRASQLLTIILRDIDKGNGLQLGAVTSLGTQQEDLPKERKQTNESVSTVNVASKFKIQ